MGNKTISIYLASGLLARGVVLGCTLSACTSTTTGSDGGVGDGSVVATPACQPDSSSGAVAMPQFVRNISTGETGWFGSPAVYDLDHDGKNEIIVADYSVSVFDAQGNSLTKGTVTQGRVYAGAVVADLDHDGITEVVAGGNNGTVAAYEYKNKTLSLKAGWSSATTCSAGQCPEARGMAAGNLSHDPNNTLEVAVTTTQTQPAGAQVFVFNPNGTLFQPAGLSFQAWPRYNTLTGAGNDADFYMMGPGNHGYGCYGENIGIGNIDDDPQLELIVTYDNHQINAFKLDGTSILAASYYTNPDSMYLNQRLGWGQFIRRLDPAVEDGWFHAPRTMMNYPDVTTYPWLQFSASPSNVVDVDGDGKNEVVSLPNVEMGMPYVTQSYAFFVLQGAYGSGDLSARRMPAFNTLPTSDQPPARASGDYYPPDGIPAPTTVNIIGDARPEIIAPINDGYVYAVSPDGTRLWRYNYANGAPKTFASEVVVADLNKDGTPELIFGVYSLQSNGGRLVVLSNTGTKLYDITLPNQGNNGNGIGVPAAPTVADVDGDGTLEILVGTFDHGVDIFTVPGSGSKCVLWATGRGNYLRNGSGPSTVTP